MSDTNYHSSRSSITKQSFQLFQLLYRKSNLSSVVASSRGLDLDPTCQNLAWICMAHLLSGRIAKFWIECTPSAGPVLLLSLHLLLTQKMLNMYLQYTIATAAVEYMKYILLCDIIAS